MYANAIKIQSACDLSVRQICISFITHTLTLWLAENPVHTSLHCSESKNDGKTTKYIHRSCQPTHGSITIQNFRKLREHVQTHSVYAAACVLVSTGARLRVSHAIAAYQFKQQLVDVRVHAHSYVHARSLVCMQSNDRSLSDAQSLRGLS
eukprot:6185593-Pleurochrysis_carterae.AAC.1